MTLKNVNFSTWLTLLMLIIFTTMVGLSFDFPAKARFMPLVVGVPGIVLCLVQLVMDLRALKAGVSSAPVHHTHLPAGVSADADITLDSELPEFGPHTVRVEITTWIYFIAFIIGLLLFGFYVAVPIMLITFLHTQAEASWKFSIAMAAAATLVLYLMFGALLGIQLFAGFGTPWILHSLGIQMV
jgi:hypothetical protein